jgi:Na+-translocating ferredoxin:NAD+ oxidoreductase RnfE subunit
MFESCGGIGFVLIYGSPSIATATTLVVTNTITTIIKEMISYNITLPAFTSTITACPTVSLLPSYL